MGDFISAFLSAGYGASPGRIKYLIQRRKHQRERNSAKAEEIRRFRRRCYSFFQSLKRDGLLIGTILAPGITVKGRMKMKELHKRSEDRLPDPFYPQEASSRVTIVIFDIPEKHRWKRAWLRSVLKNLGFEKIQQSVWIGKMKIPQELIRDLEKFNLMQCVEIFEATKLGTLSRD